MDKRQRQFSPKSPSSSTKRTKQTTKPRKTTYFFQPQNTLAFNPQRQLTDPKPDLHSDEAIVILLSEVNGEDPNTLNTKPVVASLTPMRQQEKALMDQQSSDDSFDGIRWRSTTSPNKKVDTKTMMSSPLRREMGNRSPSATATVMNELTDSVISKYGLGIQNVLSQTPGNPRSQSELASLTIDASPALLRSKSFDPRNSKAVIVEKEVSSSLSSRLNTWIDKFDTGSERSSLSHERVDIDRKEENEKAKHEISTTATTKGPNGEAAVEPVVKPEDEDDQEDDPFSDDDTFLANLKVESFLQIAPTALPNLLEPSPDDSDPFSDDLDVLAIEKNATQKFTTSFLKEARQLEHLRINSPFEEDNIGAKLSYSRPDFTRYQIKSILKTTFPHQNMKKKQLILTVVDAKDKQTKLMVRGDSAELDFKANDIIHVILTSPATPKLIDNTNNLLIWNPDILVTSTTVADQLFCPRKTVLTKRLSFPGETTIPVIVGIIVHEIFQACFITEKSTPEYLEELLEVELGRRLLEIFTIGDVVDELRTKIRKHFPFIMRWFKTFFKKPPSYIPTNKRHQKIKFSVSEALDIEESVWSPMFGIKGIADVTLRATLEGDSSAGQFLLPMEIKTSQQYLSHQAQAALYSLLFKDRYNVDISSFMLVYTLDEGSTTKHDISIPDLKSLVNLRNRISNYLQPGRQELPDLMRQQKCDKCFIQQACMTTNYMKEGGTADGSGLNEGTYEDLTSHLEGKQSYVDFLQHWDGLLSMEESFVARFNRDLWVMTSKEREVEQGKALSRLVIVKSDDNNESGEYTYTFTRGDKASHAPMDSTQISKYDKVMVSDEAGRFALAQGYVRYVNSESITVATRRRLISSELKTDKFHRATVLRTTQTHLQVTNDAVVFRIDKDEMFYGMGVARFNVLNLFLASGDALRRRLIVDLEPPRYLRASLIQCEVDEDHFNQDQVQAFEKVFSAEDYCLILGMPGTGKTTVIAELIKMLVKSRKSVLLTSYTNSAVDNILLKVKEYDIDFLRIGNPSRIHQDIKGYVPGTDAKKVRNYEEFHQVYGSPYVVAATCLGIRDLAFNVRDHFDYCIVDEASQVSMPLSLGPIAHATKFILVGDHYQLPPLVTHPSPEVKHGLSKSLFQTLADAHPQSVVELTHQYRMCEDIMLISNVLVYNNRLKCGSARVANQVLDIPNKDLIETRVNPDHKASSLWMNDIFKEENKVLFLNHDRLLGYEKTVGENISNVTEVELVRQTVEALCLSGVDETKIGVMTLYRSQLKLLLHALLHRPSVEVLTADRFQGRDKECIIISLVRSNTENRTGELLKDWRRINVAVTRARSKLIILGSESTLSRADTMRDFIELCKKKKWIYHLPSDASDVYNFPKIASSSQHSQKKASINKLGSKALGRHPLVRDILTDMNVNKT